ncbi:hypothetical protein EMCG_01017 [[Emmonsia] crescens]|uniref:Translation elongation factor EF1B beta/delta subunit guanine nucleotide exchange domain-containing protein n=1 Tax=[Emmonsia] crescens TaxID=73230 RepID=A0A0G2IDA0_9EURO|nr:hypothetical protein EMCG_01017 [Emmonsia crescens UAMH 3008]
MLTPISYTPTQADAITFKAFKNAPDATKYVHAARWYKHIASYESEFATLKGDPSRPFTTFGPESIDIPVSDKKAPEDDDEDLDLFGSDDDEEEDAALIAQREKNLAEYRSKPSKKPPAQSFVTIDIKPMSSKTPMRALAKEVRELLKGTDGVTYSFREFKPIGYGIFKLMVSFVVEDDKVSIDDLQTKIAEMFGEGQGFEVKNDVPLKDGVKVKNDDPEGDKEDAKRGVGKDGVAKGEPGLFGDDEDKPKEVKPKEDGENGQDTDEDEDEDDDGWVQSTDLAAMQKK